MNKQTKEHLVYIPFNSLILITLLQLFSHYGHLPLWLNIFVLLICLLRFFSTKNSQYPIPFYVKTTLVLASIVVFVLYYRTDFTVNMATAFLFLAVILKLIELKTNKDVVIFIFTMIYLSSVSFLFEQGILETLLQLLIMICCFYVLFIMQFAGNTVTYTHLKLLRLHAGSMLKLLLVAIPFVLVLFLFFPRVSPLWQMPLKSQATQAGLSSEMSPGDVSEIAKSSEPAFRVTFSDKKIPQRSSLYWKGLILDQFDGRKWTQSAGQTKQQRLSKIDSGYFFETQHPSYEVMLEPHQKKWAFSLDGSQQASSNLVKSEMGLFQLKTEAIQAVRYQMELPDKNKATLVNEIPTAYLIGQVNRTHSYLLQDLQTPGTNKNPRTQEFIQKLLSTSPSQKQVLINLLNLFNEQHYFYTLEPPMIGEHFVDEFLFDTKSGFCGHYASSLAYMLRISGIPSRVVIGYQGGEFNSQANYLLVSQYDAHAWVEVFLPDLGWLRVDPTAMVSPLRINNGPNQSFGNQDSFLENSPFTSAAMKYEIINWIRFRLDEINFKWQNLVVNYNQDQQESFVIKVLGEFNILRIGLFFVYFAIIFFVLMMTYLWLKSLSGYTRAEQKYMMWLFLLSKLGFKRVKGESPRMFLQRLEHSKYQTLASITAKRTRQLEEQEYRASK